MIEFNGNIGVEFRKLAQNKNSEVMIYGLDRDYSYSDVDVYSDAIAKKIVNKCQKRHIRVGLYAILKYADQTGLALQHRDFDAFRAAMCSEEEFVLR